MRDIAHIPSMMVALLKRFGSRHGRNVGWSLLGQVAPVIAAFIALPILVRLLGTERIGLLSLITIVVGYFSLLDLGLSRAVTNAVSGAIGREEVERIPVLVWSAARIQLLIGVISGGLLFVFAPFLATDVFKISAGLRVDAQQSLMVSAATLPLVLFSSTLVGILQSLKRFDIIVAIQAPASVANFLLPVLTSLLWPSLTVVVLVLAMTRLVTTFLLLRSAVREFPAIRAVHPFDRHEFLQLLKFGGWLTVSTVVNPVMAYMDRFFIGASRGTTDVAYYSIPGDAISRLLIIPSSLSQVIFPAFSSRREHSGDLYRQSMLLATCALVPPVLVILFFGPDLLALWMGDDFARQSSLVLQILSLGILANGIAFVPSTFIQAAGRPDITAKLSLIELPAYAVLAFILIQAYGIVGAAIAIDIRFIVDAAALLVVAKPILKENKETLVDRSSPRPLVQTERQILE